MRVTGGVLGGRRLCVPRSGMRPTQDRVREAFFSSIASRLPGAAFLDLFAGTGSVGIEACSRGCDSVCWVEQNRTAHRILEQNVRTLCVDGLPPGAAQVIRADATRFLAGREGPGVYDIVYADPPYDIGSAWLTKALQGEGLTSILRADGVFVMETGARDAPPDETGCWNLIDRRQYGETALWTYAPGSARP